MVPCGGVPVRCAGGAVLSGGGDEHGQRLRGCFGGLQARGNTDRCEITSKTVAGRNIHSHTQKPQYINIAAIILIFAVLNVSVNSCL